MSKDAIRALEVFGNIRRELNLVAISMLRKQGLHPKQMVMLRFLHENGDSSLTKLAQGTATDIAAASRALGPLKRAGWLKTRRNPNDRRSWVISLTPSGLSRMPDLQRKFRSLAQLFVDALSSADQRELLRILNKVSTHLQSELHAY